MNFSIITCTYNPNLKISERLVNAVKNLIITEEVNFEWIIVDNNSTKPVSEILFLEKILLSYSNYKVINEPKPGLTNARLAGIKNAQFDWVVFFDDDNEPQSDYLIKAGELINTNSAVACWGAGNIFVKFIGKESSSWVLARKDYFQERHITGEIYSSQPHWQVHYPQGTGLVIKRDVLIEYVYKVEIGEYNLSDRKGKSLMSGGDVQMVLTAVKNGYAVGISEKLYLNHLIDTGKSTFRYLLKLCYGTSSSYIKAYNEVFPDYAVVISFSTNWKIFKRIISLLRYYKIKIFRKDTWLKLASQLGEINAHYLASNKTKRPKILYIIECLID